MTSHRSRSRWNLSSNQSVIGPQRQEVLKKPSRKSIWNLGVQPYPRVSKVKSDYWAGVDIEISVNSSVSKESRSETHSSRCVCLAPSSFPKKLPIFLKLDRELTLRRYDQFPVYPTDEPLEFSFHMTHVTSLTAFLHASSIVLEISGDTSHAIQNHFFK